MVYKAFLFYKDKKLQQSWITEMKTAMPQFTKKIDELYAKALAKDIARQQAKAKEEQEAQQPKPKRKRSKVKKPNNNSK